MSVGVLSVACRKRRKLRNEVHALETVAGFHLVTNRSMSSVDTFERRWRQRCRRFINRNCAM
jgi:hypothetical protein